MNFYKNESCGTWKKKDAKVNHEYQDNGSIFVILLIYKCRKKRENAFQENTENQFRQEDRKHKKSLVACAKNRLI
jgi:hypothetical protein